MPAQIAESNEELFRRISGFSIVLTIRQRAVEIALKNLGVSPQKWEAALDEAAKAVGAIDMPEGSDRPVEDFFQALTQLLKTPQAL